MRNRYNRYRKSLFVRSFCGLLFAAFSFAFLYFMQGDLLAEAQYVYSEGITTYSPLAGAFIITFILLIIQWVIRIILPFNENYYALSYFPSCMLLAILVSIDESILVNFSWGNLVWILPIILCAYLLMVYLLYKVTSLENVNNITKTDRSVWINSLMLLVMFVIVGGSANTNDIFTYELKTERLICEGRYDKAASVGEKSLRSSRRLTELRMFALANNGMLCEQMFNYPHYFGTKGLLDISDTLPGIYRVSSSDVCKAIGVCPDENNDTQEYLEMAFNLIDSVHLNKSVPEQMQNVADEMNELTDVSDSVNVQLIKDYYYAFLLLDKDINKFCTLFDTSKIDVLPKVYSEAVVLAYEFNMNEAISNNNSEQINNLQLKKLYSRIDSVVIKRRAEYNELYNSIPNKLERMNKLRRNYGDTYWWYYDYSDSVANPIY